MKGSTDFKVTAALLALALAVGGAGLSHPLLGMMLRLAALAAVAYLVLTRRAWRFDRLTLAALAIVALVLLLPLIQLVPLPPGVWTRLPGRELPAELDSLLGLSMWRPLTLDVEATVQSFLSLLPAAVIFLCAIFLSVGDRARLLWIVLGFALFGAVLGVMQFATDGGLTPFPSGHSGYAIGLFVNRNHSAALSLVAMPIAAALATLRMASGTRRLPTVIAVVSALIVLATAVLATTSRMAMLLLPFAIASALFLTFYRQPPWRVAVPSLLGVVGLGLLLFIAGGFDSTLSRFSSLSDPRINYWTDIRWALQHYGLAGTGFGTFIPIYQSAESLDAVVPPLTNHAHNDYLEIVLEGGLPGIVLLLLFAGVLGFALWRSARSRRSREAGVVTVAATCGIAILLVCSLVDYPLRMPALSAVLAILVSMLLPNPGFASSRRQDLVAYEGPSAPLSAAAKARRFACLVPLGVLAVLVVQDAMASREMLRGRYAAAAEWTPWSTRAHDRLATGLLLANHLPEASAQALAAVRLSPIDAGAIRTLGLASLARGERAKGDRLMRLAIVLGWRDMLSQLWAIQRAEGSGETDKALQRAEGLFRQQRAMLPAMVQLLYSRDPQAVPKLAAMLAKQPPWREAFFKAARGLPAAQLPAFGRLVAALGRTGVSATSDELHPLLAHLQASGRDREAQQIWNAARGSRLVANGGFERVEERLGAGVPGEWDVPRQALRRIAVVDREGNAGRFVRIAGASGRGMVMAQDLMLAPGRYALRFRARVQGAAAADIRWELDCADSSEAARQTTRVAGGEPWRVVTFDMTVPEQDCAGQTLALEVAAATPAAEIWIDDVELNPRSR